MNEKHPLRILLADDEKVIHQTVGDYLRETGHGVNGVYDGLAALKALEAGDYDIGLIDVRMPGMDGLAFLERVQEVCPDLPVVIVTGHGNMEMAIQALRLGAADFLTKPVKLLE